ncbi:MAG: hypothetical protein AAF467_19570 [Actinomycetota bacterium]
MTSDEIPELWGRSLRMILTSELMANGEMTVAQLVDTLDNAGHRILGRPSKVISDALRWEIANGRVARVARGRYRFVTAPATTIRRIRTFAARCQEWMTARTTGDTPAVLLSDPRHHYFPDPRPLRYPWEQLGWLWAL